MRSQDLSPAAMERASAPKKTWFFERMMDGMIFACEVREAWEITYNKSTWKRRDFRLLGTSDGKTYQMISKESLARARVLEPEIEKLKEELSRNMRYEENLVASEAVDMDGDPEDIENEMNKKKVLRFRSIMDKIHAKLDVLETEYRSVVREVVKRATDAELEVARKNQQARIDQGLPLDWPNRHENILTPDTSPERRDEILGLMSKRV